MNNRKYFFLFVYAILLVNIFQFFPVIATSAFSTGDLMAYEDELLITIVTVLIAAVTLIFIIVRKVKNKEKFNKKSHKIFFLIYAFVVFFLTVSIFVLFILFLPSKIPTLMICTIIIMVTNYAHGKLKKSIFNAYYAIKKNNSEEKITANALPLTQENKLVLEQGYQLYLDIEQALMNFDDRTLENLVTNDFFQSSINQLQQLSLKNRKNIRSDFSLKDYDLLSLEKNSVKMLLKVSLYDYIIDQNGNVVSGSKNEKVVENYLLTFERMESSLGRCLHCNAKIEEGSTKCSYCHSDIQGTNTTMKLVKKEVLK